MEENLAARVKRRRVSRHEGEACGDPGKDCKSEASAGGPVSLAEQLEEPVTGGDLQTKAAGANTEPPR